MSAEQNSSFKSSKLANTKREGKRVQRHYSDEDRYIALAAVDLNGGNVYRTSKALQIPHKTLEGWVKERGARQVALAEGRREKRGDLALKMEDVLHSIIESMPTKIEKATLSQSAVAVGVLTDKIRILRTLSLEPDPAVEICRLLNINRSQLPDRLELDPGDPIVAAFLRGDTIIDVPAKEISAVSTSVQNDAELPASPLQDASANTTEENREK
jgi:transposase-like protein